MSRTGSVACYAAGVLLAAFAALLALPLQAQAQTEVWSAPVSRPEPFLHLLGCGLDRSPAVGSMTDRDFDYAGTMYTFSHIRVSSGGGLQISMTGAFSQTALDNLTFHAGSSSFALSDGTGTDNQTLSWNSAGWIWSSGQTIAISFTLTEADTTPPALSTGHQVNPTGTVIYLEFDEALEDDAALKPPTSAFTVTVDGVANAVTAVAFGVGGSASRLGLSFAETIAQGQVVTVSYADPTTGNDVASFSNIAVTNNSTVDITAPSPESSEVAAGGTSVTVNFNENLDIAVEFLPAAVVAAFTLTADGAELDIDRISVGGSESLVIIPPSGTTISQNQTVKLSYDKTVAGADALEDAAGNEVATFTDFAVTNNSTVDTTPPSPESAEVAAGGTSVTVIFDEDLDIAVEFLPAAVVDAFTLTADDVELDIDRISMGGSESLVIIPPSGTTIYFLPRVYLARRAKPALDVCETQNPTRDPIHSQVGPPNAFMRHAGSCLP